MKKLALTLVLVLGFASMAFAGWDKCAGCHNGKTAADKAAVTAKFKTAADFIKASQESKSPMMNAVKGNEAELKAAAADLGLK
ncbi:MAG: hypothetical protein H7843_13650 [Nitrospirota bacterium]|uniref:Cytochrome c domain-containing protein n=1 Tax=Candidatus Magnetominusculus xianensis TaxID=1748249 RepID=A0ABR5SFZ5_9BACT|nr:hypothetical protein [Candidatus Magnetominusculus xianensis]KWT86946.1 hypothetical protein ASN18_1418 [Candidatus Magnetominusculus xianensis]MBF0403930.1 hypothetical protein [Nitrospirota bacterium]